MGVRLLIDEEISTQQALILVGKLPENRVHAYYIWGFDRSNTLIGEGTFIMNFRVRKHTSMHHRNQFFTCEKPVLARPNFSGCKASHKLMIGNSSQFVELTDRRAFPK